ncbi:MAG: hypothetical protein IPM29_15770 [Planctomycetes bacterium]|nr:hypothetical protein [Planctomycetota bacterium]
MVLDNLDFATEHFNASASLFRARGLVILSRLYASPNVYAAWGGAQESDRVVLTRVRHNVITGPAIGTFDSNIWIIDSDIRAVYSSGQSVSPYLGGASFLGGPRNGTAWIIGSRIEGGIDHPNGNTAMDPGIYAVYCDLFITGGSTILGADYSVPTLACPSNPGSTRHWSVRQSSPSPPDPRAAWFVHDPNTTFDNCYIAWGHDLVREFPAVLPGEAIRGQQQSIVAYGATGSDRLGVRQLRARGRARASVDRRRGLDPGPGRRDR